MSLDRKQDGGCVQIFIEYVMLAHVNDNPEQAHQLGTLLQVTTHSQALAGMQHITPVVKASGSAFETTSSLSAEIADVQNVAQRWHLLPRWRSTL